MARIIHNLTLRNAAVGFGLTALVVFTCRKQKKSCSFVDVRTIQGMIPASFNDAKPSIAVGRQDQKSDHNSDA